MTDVTRIIKAIQQGDKGATDELLPLVYDELRKLAAQKLSQEPPGQTLQATALVHEVYLRLVGSENHSWDGQGHFFAAAAEAMRRILVETARRKHSNKRGGDRHKVALTEADWIMNEPSMDLIALDEALNRLTEVYPSVADLVKLRYFAGLTIEQVAQAQGISRRTAVDRWRFAQAWLYREIRKGDGSTSL